MMSVVLLAVALVAASVGADILVVVRSVSYHWATTGELWKTQPRYVNETLILASVVCT